jgi:hypothetical protein
MVVIAMSVVSASAAGDLVGYAATDHGGILDELAKLGHRVVEPTSADATHFVAMDHNRGTFSAVESRIPAANRQLIVFEPRVVLPDNYAPRVRHGYGHILSMGAAGSADGAVLPWPQRDWRTIAEEPGSHLPGTTALINANKISMISGSLYGLRREVIGAFDRAELPLTLAGSNWGRRGRRQLVENGRAFAYAAVNRQRIDLGEWNKGLPLDGTVDNIGIVPDKHRIFLQSEFAVVIENSADYVSEKLFDAMFAGCIPLYVGPELGTLGIPDGVAIQLGATARPDDFIAAVRNLSAAQKSAVIQAGREWLAEESSYQTWAMPNALRRLASAIDTNINKGSESL